MLYDYPAVLTLFDDGSGYLADIPDLPGCSTSGVTIDDAIDMITDAASLWLVFNEDEGNEIPKASTKKQIEETADGVVAMIHIDTEEYRAMLAMYPPEPIDEDDDE